MTRLRGAFPTPRHKLAAARPHRIIGDTPTKFANVPAKLSMWGNGTYGDCVSAEEAFAKATNSPELFMSDVVVIEWARARGFLNGANLTDVMDAMQWTGMPLGSTIYNDGA